VAACQGGQLVVHFTNRKNAPVLFSTRIGTRPRATPASPITIRQTRNRPGTAQS